MHIISGVVAYALGYHDKQIEKDVDKLLESDPANHILHGYFDQIFKRHAELLTRHRNQNALVSAIDALLSGSQEKDSLYKRLCFNFTIHSICLFYKPVSDKYFKKSSFARYLEREWLHYNSKIGLDNAKVAVNEYLVSSADKSFFDSKAGIINGSLDGLYMSMPKIGSIAVEARKAFYFDFASHAVKAVEMSHVWRWIFGESQEIYSEKKINKFSVVYKEFHKSTMAIMLQDQESGAGKQSGKDRPSGESENCSLVLTCPACGVGMRVKLPINTSKGRCGKCRSEFVLKGDGSGGVWAERVGGERESFHGSSDNSEPVDLSEALTMLGLSDGATSADIKSAYRKKISEYHPDKVHSLGDKLKKVALDETQKLNDAIDVLKRGGML